MPLNVKAYNMIDFRLNGELVQAELPDDTPFSVGGYS